MRRLRTGLKLLRDLTAFARQNKVYWIVPLVLLLGMFALLAFAGQAAVPFIYTLF